MNRSVGLDIGWESIKAVEIDDDFWISKYAKVEIPRPFEGDENALYISKISELFSGQEFSRVNVITNLRGSSILARSYTMSSLNDTDFEQWFVENIDSLIPGVPLDDVFYAHQLLDKGRVLISFTRLRPLRNQLAILKSCDIVPRAIDASCLALHYVFANHTWTKKRKNYALLNIGGFNSELLIMKEGTPFASMGILFGCKYLRKGRNKYRICHQELVKRVQKAFLFYREREDLIVDGLIVVGDCSKIPGMRKNVKQLLGIRIETTIPEKFDKGFINDNGRHYALAVGLALKGLKCDTGINLMPPEVRSARKAWLFDKKARKFFWKNLVVSTIVFAVFAGVFFPQIMEHSKALSEKKALVHEKDALVSIVVEENALNAKSRRLRQLNNNQYFWSRLLYDIGCAVPPGTYLKEVITESRMVSTGKEVRKARKVTIDGEAPNSQAVIVFVKNLEKHFPSIVVDQMKAESRCEFKISLAL
jgi:Tfp pilus assembly PilM family ATPase